MKKKKKKKNGKDIQICVLCMLHYHFCLFRCLWVGVIHFSVSQRSYLVFPNTLKFFSCSTRASASNLYWIYIENLPNFRILTVLVLILYRLESIKKVTHGGNYHSKCCLVSAERYLTFHLPQKIILCTSNFRTPNLYQEFMTKWTKFRILTV